MNCFCIDFFAVKRRKNSNKFASVHCVDCFKLERWIEYKEYANFYPKIKQEELNNLIRKKSIEMQILTR